MPNIGDTKTTTVKVEKKALESYLEDLKANPLNIGGSAGVMGILGVIAGKYNAMGAGAIATASYLKGIVEFGEYELNSMIRAFENKGKTVMVVEFKLRYQKGPNSKLGTGWYPVSSTISYK